MKIFVSQSQDPKKNPLDYGTKIKFIREMFPEYSANVVDDPGLNTVVKVASYLYDQGYNAATFVAGSDRLEDMAKLLKQYNGIEGKAHGYYKFDSLEFVSSGEREDGAEGVAGVSASGAREAAANNNFEKFQSATGAGKLAKPLFVAVRKGMKISESISESKIDMRQIKLQIQSDAHDMGDDFGEDKETILILAKEYNLSPSLVRDMLRSDMLEPMDVGDALDEAPIEMDPADPMDPMIHSHDKANPAKLKYRMLRAAGQLKDLASRAEGASPAEWQTMARQFEELKMNMEQIRHALEELGKMRKKGGIRSRGIDPMLDSFKYPFAGAKVGQKAGRAGQLKGTDPKEYPKHKLVGG